MKLSPDVRGAVRLCSMAMLAIGGCFLLAAQCQFRAERRDAVTLIGAFMVMIAIRLGIAEGRARERSAQDRRGHPDD